MQATFATVPPQPAADAASLRVLNTRQCLEMLGSILEFERSVCGREFSLSEDEALLWSCSGSLFYAAVGVEDEAGYISPCATLSLYLCSRTSRDRLLKGLIARGELSPWFIQAEEGEVCAFLASHTCAGADLERRLWERLRQDLSNYLTDRELKVTSSFAIADSPETGAVLQAHGFVPAGGANYLGEHAILELRPGNAGTAFWSWLLETGEHTFSRPEPAEPLHTISLDQFDKAVGREVEKRLTHSGLDRPSAHPVRCRLAVRDEEIVHDDVA